VKYHAALLATLVCSITALVWAKWCDSFERIEFSVGRDEEQVKGIVVLPKPVGRHPTVVYLYGSGGSLIGSGRELRQLAELGLAAVGIEYSQTNQVIFDEQFRAVSAYVSRQPWALEGATAWMGFSLGAQRALGFAVRHPELQPKLIVRLAGGWVNELEAQAPASSAIGSPSTVKSKVLLVHGEQDEVFSVADCRRVAGVLRDSGIAVDLRILPDLPHAFGAEWASVFRAAAEYCAAKLPLTDYAGAVPGCTLSPVDGRRFNEAMERAGRHRRELWRAVTASREPERHTVMNVISRLEDYDLAHISKGQLLAATANAWRMRRAYPWCRDTPLDTFETFTATPRIFEEPLDGTQPWFSGRLRRDLKYCHTQRQAIDAAWRWMRERTAAGDTSDVPEGSPKEILKARGTTDCKKVAMLYTFVARSAGLATRPVFSIDRAAQHYWTEVWNPEAKQWCAYDGGPVRHANEAGLGKPLSVILAPTGERGVWNAEAEDRWEAYTNNIGLFYPSGKVTVRVLDHGRPVTRELVAVLSGRFTPRMVERAWTDQNGEAQFTLGMSQVLPYRIVLAQTGEADWQWLQVKSNAVHEVVLRRENRNPYDSAVEPPPLVLNK
jgi:predicted esterase